ncbi:hypothetical protein GJV85_05065 [Sulfurimonas aquatica]|uniref:Uncharacterized protein n=1 Tax=Sulfurimonas aquatica TaxID=2672570 RepID=A0A975AZL9_9BACT|nr:hypothetical protein [Sulfurimonas aquatica]QSZ41501.1 hypothetical protein GJV85_05065 [Sulfurimonas aquatica]
MSRSDEHSFSSVISVNPYNDTYTSSVSSFINSASAPSFSKDQFAISYLNTKDFINAQIEISKNIPDEDLYDAINNKAYDELALDQAVEYQIQYIETFNNLDENNRFFHVFIVDPLKITHSFSRAIEKIKYLDVIIPAPLLLKSLYSKEIIDSAGVHCFIYIQESDAFVTIYADKEFVYTKSIKFSIIDMHERFCELYGERIEYSSFFNFFTTQSLRDTDSDYKSYFIKLYKELFSNVNDILTYTKRAFEIEKFEQIFIGSQVETVTQLDEMLEVELHIKSSQFNFDYGFESEESYIDQIHALMHIYAAIEEDARYDCNFTVYNRPPSFIKRESGKIILLIAASFALAFAYPVSYWVLNYAQLLQEDFLKQEYNKLHIVKITREATLKNRLADKTKSTQILSDAKNEYINKKNTLIKIHDVKVNYPMKAKLIALLTKDLNKYGVKMETLNYIEIKNKKIFNLSLVASKDKKITKLVEFMTKEYEGKFKFKLEDISYDEESKVYLSPLEVVIL